MRKTLVLLMGNPMRRAVVLVWLTAVVVGSACVSSDTSPVTGPSYSSPAVNSSSGSRTRAGNYDVWKSRPISSLRPNDAWTVVFGTNLQGTRNTAVSRCEARGGGSCESLAECVINNAEASPYAAVAMTDFSNTFPIGRFVSLRCGTTTVSQAESLALISCSNNPATKGPCRIWWSGSMFQ